MSWRTLILLPTMFQFKCRDINLRLRCETFPGFQQRPGVSFFFEVDHDKPVTGICIFVDGNIHSFCFQTYLIFCTTIYSLKRVNRFHKRVICHSWNRLRRLKLIRRMLKPPPEFWIEVRPSSKSGHEWEIPQMRPLLEVVTLRREDPPISSSTLPKGTKKRVRGQKKGPKGTLTPPSTLLFG